MVIYLSHLLVTPSTDIDHIHDAQFHDGGLRRLSGLRRRVRDAKRAGKGVDFYGINEKIASTPSGIVAKIHKKWALSAVLHPKILIQKTLDCLNFGRKSLSGED